ncbi:MAG: hypothetical protein LUI14_14725 [Lachnospiraceae bacterium]|nr:hypothetical protein [Lachnospiraceae bacterium]MCD7765959.1 hypothetical protein [Lachnospiraceae bacterium]
MTKINQKNRAAAFVIALVLLFVMCFSSFYVVKNANHHCFGEQCPICEQIAACENTLHGFSLAAAVIAAVLFVPALCTSAVKPLSVFSFSDTLVSLKVKLSN